MKSLLGKEIRLVVHPSTYALVILGALMLIPSWMYGAIFIYGILVAFFNGMNAREMRDLEYSFSLPASSCDMVRARIFVMAAIEILMLAILIAFTALRVPLGINGIDASQTSVGCAANLYLAGFGFVLFGIFNAVFYPLYYRDPTKVGIPFLIACVPVTVVICMIEALPYLPVSGFATFGIPGFHDVSAQLIFLVCGIALFVLCTFFSIRLAAKRFSTYDA